MEKKILILTYQDDPHAEAVSKYLDGKDILNLIIDTDKVVDTTSLTFHSSDSLYNLRNLGYTISLDDSWNIWNRRVMDPEICKGMPEDLEELIFNEWERSWDGLLISHSGKVVNRPHHQVGANNKIEQLRFARSKGEGRIQVPDTLLTNDPEELRKFYERHNGNICFKLQRGVVVRTPKGNKILYTNKVMDEHLRHADLVKTNPYLFQEYIEKDIEMRIIATDRECTAIGIHSQDSDSERSRIDYRRYDFKNVRYNFVDIPRGVSDFCSEMIHHYKLHFGAFDFIRSKSGQHYFLELNPNGQWLWLEEQSGYNLTKQVAENLIE